MLFILRGEHGRDVHFEKLKTDLEEVGRLSAENRQRLRDIICIRILEAFRPDLSFAMFF